MPTIEAGLRERHDRTAELMRQVERGAHIVVKRHGQPIAAVVPLAAAARWVLENRPLPPSWDTDEEAWYVEGLVRVAPTAEDAACAVGDERPTLLAVGRRIELERWLRGQPN